MQDGDHADITRGQLLEKDEVMGVLDEENAFEFRIWKGLPTAAFCAKPLHQIDEITNVFTRLLLIPSRFRVVPELDDLQLGCRENPSSHGWLSTIWPLSAGCRQRERPVKILEFLVDDLDRQIKSCIRQWEKDRAKGLICPHPQESLMRKFSRSTFGTMPWYWLFPSANVRGDNPLALDYQTAYCRLA
jgi:hypothetical protein